MRGRKPKPTSMKVLTGNPGKRPLPVDEPKFSVAVMHVPRHLPEVGKREWRRLVKVLRKAGLLTAADRGALAAYCSAYATWVEASLALKEEGRVLVSDKGIHYASPWVKIERDAVDQMRRFGIEFGMTPSSRSRVTVEKPEEPDELEKLLFGSKAKVVNSG